MKGEEKNCNFNEQMTTKKQIISDYLLFLKFQNQIQKSQN